MSILTQAKLLATAALGFVAAAGITVTASAAPANYPKGPVTFIVSYSAGGGSDAGARILANSAEKHVGKPVVVQNKPGAGGGIGWTSLVNSKPDGQTMALINVPSLIFLPLQGMAQYKLEQIEPIIQLVDDPALLMVQKNGKFKDYADFIAQVKANPDKITMATCGVGSDIHIIAEIMNDNLGIKLNSVHFPGTVDAVTSVIGGHSDVTIPKVSEAISAVEAGQALILASFSEERLADFPDVPTLKELGLALNHSSSRGVAVPKGTPQEIVDFLQDALKKATEEPEYIERMKSAGLAIKYRSGPDFGKFYMSQYEMFKPVIERLGLNQPK
jgi:tripartite-type tricarboxylate transporter receptor subunit TctC